MRLRKTAFPMFRFCFRRKQPLLLLCACQKVQKRPIRASRGLRNGTRLNENSSKKNENKNKINNLSSPRPKKHPSAPYPPLDKH